MLLSFLQVLVKHEWQLSYAEEAGITAVVFLGELPGALFWGVFGDRYGRRRGFLWSTLCIACFGLLSAFTTNIFQLMLCRAFVGFGVSGNVIPFDLMAEFLPDAERARVLLIFQMFWTLGIAFVAALAWIVIEPLGWRWLTGTSPSLQPPMS
jgi:MFS family permease